MHESIISMEKPKLNLNMQMPESFSRVGVPFKIAVSIKNPYKRIPLTNCNLYAQTDVLAADLNVKINNVGPDKEMLKE